eukprot:TRINITY_DN24400_c1_g1_i1.p1 TRINITY_DN24400_c1_g1~~TRINITY_DN24400_c1_g1_i1.p1  ORF type:complete len:854 (-),score=162.62 TRINITY_DN24400_c1_g1_i1:40-2601(-)
MSRHGTGNHGDTHKLVEAVTKAGGGSILRGWRRELDPDGDFEVTYQEFCRAATRLGCNGNYDKFFHGDNVLSLEELVPVEGAMMRKFRAWMQEVFGGAEQMFIALDEAQIGTITSQEFVNGIKKKKCHMPDHDIVEVYRCCDVDDGGSLTMEEVVYLEVDASERAAKRAKYKKSSQEDIMQLMATAYAEDAARGLGAKHRRAQRLWWAGHLEQLPALMCKKRAERHMAIFRMTLEARIAFLYHLRTKYGTEARAWRRGLDPEGTFEVPQASFQKFCRKADLKLNISLLWRALDKDGDGWFRLEELCVKTADVLASFKSFADSKFGSCVAFWDHPTTAKIRQGPQTDARWASTKKMLIPAVYQALQAHGFKTVEDAWRRYALFSALDIYSCGFISREDLKWLDRWDPPDWIVAQPDPQAWAQIRAAMLKIYDHPLRAWRNLLDVDNSNVVSWAEFQAACKKLKYTGPIGGAWRHLDEHLRGAISMREYDQETADLLESFKSWCDDRFGSVSAAFKVLDKDGSETLSLGELKKACRKLKWDLDVKLLFEALDVGGSGTSKSLTLKDVSWLDCWNSEMTPDHVALEQEMMEDLEERIRKARAMAKAATLTRQRTHVRAASAPGQERPQTAPASSSKRIRPRVLYDAVLSADTTPSNRARFHTAPCDGDVEATLEVGLGLRVVVAPAAAVPQEDVTLSSAGSAPNYKAQQPQPLSHTAAEDAGSLRPGQGRLSQRPQSSPSLPRSAVRHGDGHQSRQQAPASPSNKIFDRLVAHAGAQQPSRGRRRALSAARSFSSPLLETQHERDQRLVRTYSASRVGRGASSGRQRDIRGKEKLEVGQVWAWMNEDSHAVENQRN